VLVAATNACATAGAARSLCGRFPLNVRLGLGALADQQREEDWHDEQR
jgi:hypothetical protein